MMLFKNGILQEKPDRHVIGERFWSKSRWVGQEKMNASDDYSPGQKECKCGRKRRAYHVKRNPDSAFGNPFLKISDPSRLCRPRCHYRTLWLRPMN